MPFPSRTPTSLTPEQRHALTQIPADLSDREIARYYTFTQRDLDLIASTSAWLPFPKRSALPIHLLESRPARGGVRNLGSEGASILLAQGLDHRAACQRHHR